MPIFWEFFFLGCGDVGITLRPFLKNGFLMCHGYTLACCSTLQKWSLNIMKRGEQFEKLIKHWTADCSISLLFYLCAVTHMGRCWGKITKGRKIIFSFLSDISLFSMFYQLINCFIQNQTASFLFYRNINFPCTKLSENSVRSAWIIHFFKILYKFFLENKFCNPWFIYGTEEKCLLKKLIHKFRCVTSLLEANGKKQHFLVENL